MVINLPVRITPIILNVLNAATFIAQVPYFLISHADMPLDGSTPTLLYGYGGFEISLPPAYSGVVGAGWLDTTGEETEGEYCGCCSCMQRCCCFFSVQVCCSEFHHIHEVRGNHFTLIYFLITLSF